MKKKTLVIFFALIILVIIQVIFINPAEALTVNDLRKKFPNGKYWNHPAGEDHRYQYGIIDQGKCNNPDGWTDAPCNAHNGTTASLGQNDCNSFDRGQQCVGFARKLFFDYYGTYATNAKIYTNIDNLKPGDILRYKRGSAGGHDVWVIGMNGDNITVAECNWGDRCIIRWDRTFSKKDITVERIYSAPRALTDGRDIEPPKILESYVDMSSISQNQYKIIARVTDNTGIEKVLFPTWTNANGQDDLIWKEGTYNKQINAWEFWVKKSEHNNALDLYHTHIYAYDTSGNSSFTILSAVPMGGTIANLGSFKAKVELNKDKNYVIGINNSNVVLKQKNNADNSQIWNFTRNSDGSYYIENTSNGMSLDILNGTGNNGENVQTFIKNNSKAQRFFIMNYNGAYRIVSDSAPDLKALDLNNEAVINNCNIQLYEAGSLNNNAQTWNFEIIEEMQEGIEYNTHVQNIGWQGFVANGSLARNF